MCPRGGAAVKPRAAGEIRKMRLHDCGRAGGIIIDDAIDEPVQAVAGFEDRG
jgi:hypothetical protein